MKLPRFRFSIRTGLVATVVAAVACAYVGSYFHLKRRGIAEMNEFGFEGYLFTDAKQTCSQRSLALHHKRKFFYKPIWYLDCLLFVGRQPVHSITFLPDDVPLPWENQASLGG